MTFDELMNGVISAKDKDEFFQIMCSVDLSEKTEFCIKLLEKIRTDRESFKHKFSWGIIELSTSHFFGNKLNVDIVAETCLQVIDETKLDDLTLGGITNLRMVRTPKEMIKTLLSKIWEIINISAKWHDIDEPEQKTRVKSILEQALFVFGSYAELSEIEKIKKLLKEENEKGGESKNFFGNCLLIINRRLKPEHRFCKKCNKETIWDAEFYDFPFRCTKCGCK